MTVTFDRRTTHRLHRKEDHGIVAARVRPGHSAHLVDVSVGGALIDTSCRLLPGTSVELHLETETSHTMVRGRVLRSIVIRLRASSICYRGAIAFDRDLPWYVPGTDAVAGHPAVRPLHPRRALVTPEVI